ncbi:hypothetical protein ALNOE001_21520 [Candidatus Methanobinarius endosymbioticus]|uniref:Energy-converting hydrogenase B subunit J n=1 Tax=Candidatus Methanobinarius endosymbioticus TaxID=2006182 RepID=A0A366M898_9EURY|nr:hypothetical protein ALNOE001_21520 [Candidatus Methanobinarius endosymbioticus]
MLYLGPVIFGFILGLVVGIRVKNNPNSNIKFTTGFYIIIFIVALIVAWYSGPYPFFDDVPISTAFISGTIGLIAGSLIRKISGTQ